jgi:hypothetical protein
VAAQLAASHEEISSMELIKYGLLKEAFNSSHYIAFKERIIS